MSIKAREYTKIIKSANPAVLGRNNILKAEDDMKFNFLSHPGGGMQDSKQ
jgi:hypothetical protein